MRQRSKHSRTLAGQQNTKPTPQGDKRVHSTTTAAEKEAATLGIPRPHYSSSLPSTALSFPTPKLRRKALSLRKNAYLLLDHVARSPARSSPRSRPRSPIAAPDPRASWCPAPPSRIWQYNSEDLRGLICDVTVPRSHVLTIRVVTENLPSYRGAQQLCVI